MCEEKVISEISNKIVDWLMSQPYGTEISLSEICDQIYMKEGYKWIRHKKKGWVSSKDDGKTYLIEDMEFFGILNKVEDTLKTKERYLDFSKWDNMYVGLPYNIPFVIRKGTAKRK